MSEPENDRIERPVQNEWLCISEWLTEHIIIINEPENERNDWMNDLSRM